jgi:hypothetical protein
MDLATEKTNAGIRIPYHIRSRDLALSHNLVLSQQDAMIGNDVVNSHHLGVEVVLVILV